MNFLSILSPWDLRTNSRSTNSRSLFCILLTCFMSSVWVACGSPQNAVSTSVSFSTQSSLNAYEEQLNALGIYFNSNQNGFYLDESSPLYLDPLVVHKLTYTLQNYANEAEKILVYYEQTRTPNELLSLNDYVLLKTKRKAALTLARLLNQGRN